MKILQKLLTSLLNILVLFSFLVSNYITAFAEDTTDLIHSITLTYGEDIQKDVWNDIFVVDNGTDGEMVFDFDFDFGFSQMVYKIEIYSVTEKGEEKLLQKAEGRGVKTIGGINSFDLPSNTGLKTVVYDYFGKKRIETMLGVLITKNEAREKFQTNINVGPKDGIKIDMDSLAPGMSFGINLFTIPIEYRRFPDGRSVIGLGWNSTNQSFWEGAAKGKFPTLSHGEVVKKWKTEHGETERSKFGLCWSVGGYAMTYDNNPNKMSGIIQFYVGTGGEQAGQYAIFTYSVTITIGAQGTITFTLEPMAETPFYAELEAAFMAGLELYGGIGIGCLASIGIYGAGTFGADFHVLPDFYTKEVYVEGEMGLKAKVLGRTIMTFTFVKGRHDFVKRVEEDGTEVYFTTIDLRQEYQEQFENMVLNGYAYQTYEINETSGETIWYTDNLDQADNNTAHLYAGDDGQMLGDRTFSKTIAENINPENGVQVKKLYDNNSAIILLVGNNDSRESGRKGELLYLIYDHNTKSLSIPQPVITNIDGDGIEDTGGDFSPRLIRGTTYNSVYATWLRGTEEQSAQLSLTDAASDMQLCFAQYDVETNTWVNYSIVSGSNEYIIGGSSVGFINYGSPEPVVFAYTNPSDDPAGLSENSEHNILAFRRDEQGQWVSEVIDSVQGRITRFDGGQYFFSDFTAGEMMPAATYSLEVNGNKSVSVVTYGEHPKKTFENAWNSAFTNTENEIALTFMKDQALYFASGYRQDYAYKIFPTDNNETIPNATYSIIGDIYNSNIIGYLKSEGTSQDLSGFVRLHSYTEEYGRTDITDVDENTIVNYFDGVFLGDDEPVIIYSTQEYFPLGNGEFEDGISNLCIQVGAENTHVSAVSAELSNYRELDGETQAEISISMRNNGLVPIDYVNIYSRKVGTDEYILLGTREIERLKPGGEVEVSATIPDNLVDNPQYTVALVGCSQTYPRFNIQTEIPIDMTKGEVIINETDYEYRKDFDNDYYNVEIIGYGVAPRSGKLVFYNSETLEIYKEEPFENLKLRDMLEVRFGETGMPLSKKYPNLAVRVLEEDEKLDDERPTEKYQPLFVIPSWFQNIMKISEKPSNPVPTTTPTPSTTSVPEPTSKPTNQQTASAVKNNQIVQQNTQQNIQTKTEKKANKIDVKTGDLENGVIYSSGLMVSGILLIFLLLQKKNNKGTPN